MPFIMQIINMAIAGISLFLRWGIPLLAYAVKDPKKFYSMITEGLKYLEAVRIAARRDFYQKHIETITITGAKPVDLHAYQIEMEELFSNNQLHSRIKQEFQQEQLFTEIFEEFSIPADFGYDLLVQMHLHKRAQLPVLVGLLNRHFANDTQATADMLLIAANADLLDWDESLDTFVVKYEITDDVQKIIDTYQYPLPMIVKPKKLKSNYDSGYLNHKCSIILKNNHHDDDVCLDFINQMNSVPLRINHRTAQLVHNKWKSIDKQKADESFADWKKRQKAFDKYNRTAHDVLNHIAVAGNKFYLTHRYDKRGRVYCQGYHVSYQGTAWNKSVIEFYDGELVDGF